MTVREKTLTGVTSCRRNDCLVLIVLLLLALFWRSISLANSQLINHDGLIYLLQAKALYFRQPEIYLKIYPFPTNLSFMIAGLYHWLGDWILAGRLISVFFGVLTVLPLYLLARQFWQLPTAFLIVLAYVVSPTFVEFSRDILRGPPFWFFYTLGMLLFCRYLEKYDGRFLLAVVLAFLLAGWSRIEGLLPLFVVGIWLLVDRRARRWPHLALYCLPLLLLGLLSGCLVRFYPICSLTFKPLYVSGGERLALLAHHYLDIKQGLRDLAQKPPFGVAPYFFNETRHLLWFTALGVVGRCVVRAFSWPLILLCFVGLWRRERTVVGNDAQKRGRLFLAFMLVGGFLPFYGHVLLSWASSERFTAIIYFPFLIFLGFGIEKIVTLLQQKMRWQTRHSFIGLGLLWIALALPQFFDHGRRDYKIPFKNFGQQLAAKSLPESGVRILSTTKAALYTCLYANLSQTHVRPLGEQCRIIGSCDIDENLLRKGGFDYLIVIDNDGSRTRLTQVLASARVSQLRLAAEMTIPKYGRVYFYERP